MDKVSSTMDEVSSVKDKEPYTKYVDRKDKA